MRTKASLAVLVLCVVVAPAGAETVGWRGDGTGRYPAADPPVRWGLGTNIVWQTPMPNWSNASTILVGNRIFVCSEPSKLLCVSARDGTILWERTVDFLEALPPEEAERASEQAEKGEELNRRISDLDRRRRRAENRLKARPRQPGLKQEIESMRAELAELKDRLKSLSTYTLPRTGPTTGYATPTPTSDGTHVYVLFGTGAAACFDLAGTMKWARVVEIKDHKWGHSASPLLVGDRLLVHILKLIALDTATGEPVWTHESEFSWGSPVHTRIDGVDVAVTPRCGLVRVRDGVALCEELIRHPDSASPIVHDGVGYFVEGNQIVAVRFPAKADGSEKPKLLWRARPKVRPAKQRYYQSPVYHDGIVYAMSSRFRFYLSALDARTGAIFYTRQLTLAGKRAYPSITLAGRLLYAASTGETAVFRPGRQYEEVARNKLEDFRASPLFAGKRMYVRGMKHLCCVGGE